MNVFGIGPQEMMIIAVLALLVFGPGKLPEVMGQAGKLVRDFRRMSAELSGEFEKTIAEARDATSGLTAELGGMSKEVNSVTNSVKKDLGLKGGTAGSKAKSTAGTKTGTAASKAGSTSKASTSKTTGTGSKTSTAKGTTSTTTSSAVTKKASTPVASREDPAADMSLFAPTPVERKARSRKAVPSIISDPTPRDMPAESEPGMGAELASVLGDSQPTDALARSRQRRRNAGYARQSA